MIRAAFFACALFVTLCGAATAFVDRFVLTDFASGRLRQAVAKSAEESSALHLIYAADESDSPHRREVIDPPDWAAFAILSVGIVALLYAVCLPGKARDVEEEDH